MNPAEPTPALIFPDERPSGRLLILAMLLLLSALAHAITFYIIQVAYTPTVTLAPPPAEVTLLAPGSPENLALHRWLGVTDPGLMTQPSGPGRDLAALSFRYVPSYASAPPAYRPLKFTPPAGALPAQEILGPAPLPPIAAPPRPPVPSSPSRVTLDPVLARLAPPALAPLRFSLTAAGVGAKPLEATVFLVGARAEGGLPFIFRQASSGNSAADEYARGYLAQLPLSAAPVPPDAPVLWGRAAFHWGAEVFR